MAHKRTQKQLLNNAILDGLQIIPTDAPALSSLASLSNSRSRTGLILPQLIEFTATDQVFDVTDSGGAVGGALAEQIFTLPLSERVILLGSYLSVEVKAISGTLSDGTYNFGVGTEAATATLTANEINFLTADLDAVVSSGVSAKAAQDGPLIVTYLDSNTALPVYFNGYVPDASISDDGTITADVVFRAMMINMAMGDTV